jgi:transposase
MGSKKRRTYTPEYRVEAARLVIDTGRPIAHVAKEIGIGAQLLGKWVAKERDRLTPVELGPGERVELERLRKENAQLKEEIRFLGEAAAFFAAKTAKRTVSS